MANELVVFDEDKVTALEDVVKQCNLQVLESEGTFQRQFKMAAGMKAIGEMITAEMMTAIMSLQNNGLGFKTDKPQGYPVDIVKQVTIEATLRGVNMVGNEVNIISGSCYLTKNGLRRLVVERPGITEFDLQQDVPKKTGDGALVGCKATWKLNGADDFLEKRGDGCVPVRVNSGMGIDAILGKAKRKMYALVYDRLTGSKIEIPEGDVDDAIDVPFTSTERKVGKSNLLKKPTKKKPAAEPEESDADKAADSAARLKEYKGVIAEAKTTSEANHLADDIDNDDVMSATDKFTASRAAELRSHELV